MDAKYGRVAENTDWYLHLLNALCGKYVEWSRVKARKDHECEFGCHVDEGQQYYRKCLGGDRANDLKLCHDCMVRLLYMLFATDAETAELATARLKKQYGSLMMALGKIEAARMQPTPQPAEPIAKPATKPALSRDAFLAKVRADHPRAYEKWTEEEDLRLGRMFSSGKSPRKIAEALQRQPGAITSRLRKLGFIEADSKATGR